MNKNLTGNMEEFCNALSVPERVSLIRVLGMNEMCACRLIEGTGMHPTVLSNHMRVLRMAGIVSERKEQEGTYYAISNCEAIEAATCGSCLGVGNTTEDLHLALSAQNINVMIGKYKSSYVYEAEALFRRGC